MLLLSIGSDIKFGVLDILRGIGMAIINIIFSTIDTLYNVAERINSLNLIQMLENVDNSPFNKIFNAFFILSFVVLLLFAVWKISFRILDADTNEQPLFELVKEIVKCGFLIFSIYLIFNTSINIGINLSSSIYNNFTTTNSTIGDKMKTSYLTLNEACYKVDKGDNVDKENVKKLKEKLEGYANVSSAKTMADFENLIRNDTINATQISDSGSFSFRCSIYKQGIWNDKEDYAFNYNFLFGIIIGTVFLFSIGFSVLMLGRRQLELAFLMVISPLVIATSVGRKEQDYFTKVVAQSVLYLGCAMMLMTGCTSLNRFIGENVSANSGRDMMMAMRGLKSGIIGAGAIGLGATKAAKDIGVGTIKAGKGIGQVAKGGIKTAKGMYYGASNSYSPSSHQGISRRMGEQVGKGISQMMKGEEFQKSSNPIARAYGRMLSSHGESNINDLKSKWDFSSDTYNPDYIKSGVSLARAGINNIKDGFGGAFNSIKNIGNPNSMRYKKRPKISEIFKESEKI